MSLDDQGRRAAETLHERVLDDLAAAEMLASLPRTRSRRRMALAAPLAAIAVAVAAMLTNIQGGTSATPSGPGPTAPASASPRPRANGAIFADGSPAVARARRPRGATHRVRVIVDLVARR